MSVVQVAILVAAAAALGRLRGGRPLATLGVSALAVFWLQPAQSPTALQFWIPTATIGITAAVWGVTAPPQTRGFQTNWTAALVLAAAILLADLNHYFRLEAIYLVDTPRLRYVAVSLMALGLLILLLASRRRDPRALLWLSFAAVVSILVALKTPAIAEFLRNLIVPSPNSGATPTAGASTLLPASGGIQWLGYSYLAFRLLHTILDRRSGRLPALTLAEFGCYVIFFPAFTAGPIDRAERFTSELRSPLPVTGGDWMRAATRILVGLFKKFVIADSLAIISINQVLASHVQGAGWLWVFVYAYALRIFFDFSGYTDLAIGAGRLMGIQMPENFTAPYLKPNLTLFWNSWHITLTQWFRAYFFNPVVRSFRTSAGPLPAWIIILAAQVGTMILIGLWHGLAWSFVVWGLWHGLGLFVHNRWVALSAAKLPDWTRSVAAERLLRGLGIALTFNFVSIGWLFFTFDSPAAALHTLLRLFGAS